MKRKVAEILGPTALTLRLEAIRTDLGTQMRPALNREHVADLAELYEDGAALPPLEVYHDGQMYILTDGFHRLEAMRAKGKLEAECQVHEGSLRDALLRAAQVNNAHGLRRDNATKRAAVLTLLQDEHWRKWSDREIARQCLVSNTFVGEIRKTLQPTQVSTLTPDAPQTRTGGDGKQYPSSQPTQSKKTEFTEPSLEYLEQTASTSLSVAALEAAWTDWARAEGLDELELRTALEANSRAFFGYLDGLRKQYNRRDVLEAANNVLARLGEKQPMPTAAPSIVNVDNAPRIPIEGLESLEDFAPVMLEEFLVDQRIDLRDMTPALWYQFAFELGRMVGLADRGPYLAAGEIIADLVNWELNPAECAPSPGFGDEPAQLAEREAKLGKVANSIINQPAVDAVEHLEAEICAMLASTYPAAMHLEVLDGGAVPGILHDRGVEANKNQLAEAIRRVRDGVAVGDGVELQATRLQAAGLQEAQA